MPLPPNVRALLACPICKNRLNLTESACCCTNDKCGTIFPIVDTVPVLINEHRSVFRIEDYQRKPAGVVDTSASTREFIKSLVPSITHNWVGDRNYAHLASLLEDRPVATVLIVGAGELGEGLHQLLRAKNCTIIESDIYFGERTVIIADGHDLPFLAQSMDAVIIQAVLEHVLDPVLCVDEIRRVLKLDGFVYAETPFLQPVHLGSFDFTRFSQSGHRRLFRGFKQIDAEVVGGPGVALAVSIRSFVRSLSTSRLVDAFATLVLPFLVFWLKYVDYFLISKPHVADYAAGTYFLGVRSEVIIPDTEIIEGHWSKRLLRG